MRVALIAHDNKKDEIIRLANEQRGILKRVFLIGTGTTSRRIKEEVSLDIKPYRSGPLGGDQQIGALISEKELDMVIFLRDPLTAQAHEPDINALLRICDVYNVPVATNYKTAKILLNSISMKS